MDMPAVEHEELFEIDKGNKVLNFSEYESEKLIKLTEIKPERPSDKMVPFDREEMGFSDLFAMLYDKECRYCTEWKTWMVWNGSKWVVDVGGIDVMEKLQGFAQIMNIYSACIKDKETRESYVKATYKLYKRRFRESIMKDAETNLKISADKFDADPYIINCQNGTYNLKTREFYNSRYDDYLTYQTNFKFTVDRSVNSDRWLKFIKEVTQEDTAKADFLQRALGYSLLGRSNEECMFILYGKTTRNGKSTLLNTLQKMLGDYSKVAPVGMICKGSRKKDAESASPTLAGLKGKRFVTMAESNEYGRLDEEKIKQLTGGEEISARALYQSAFTFTPQFTMWLSCNDLPAVTDKTLFTSERLKVIEFNRHFTRDERDVHLKDELLEPGNMIGIFNWLIDGYEAYEKRGLEMSSELLKVIDRYEADNDSVLTFLLTKCKQSENAEILETRLFRAYSRWSKEYYGYCQLNAKRFRNEMARHNRFYIDFKRDKEGIKYVGLEIL